MIRRDELRRCRSCRATIVWAFTSTGRAMPVDAATDPTGNLLLTRRADGEIGVQVVPADYLDREQLHRPHFATCPEADAWRRGR